MWPQIEQIVSQMCAIGEEEEEEEESMPPTQNDCHTSVLIGDEIEWKQSKLCEM